MLDDLRRSAMEDDSFDEDIVEDDPFAPADTAAAQGDRLFLGMTAVERMFLSIFFFMNVLVFGLALLMATGRFSL
jgi:hypothetical protein